MDYDKGNFVVAIVGVALAFGVAITAMLLPASAQSAKRVLWGFTGAIVVAGIVLYLLLPSAKKVETGAVGGATPSASIAPETLPGSDPPSTASWQTPQVSDPPPPLNPPTTSEPPITEPQPSATSEAPPPIPVVDRVQISTWAYDKAGLNTYIADNAGGKKIRVSWTATANGYEVTGACASSVRIQGPDTDIAKNSSNCSDSMGTYLDVHQVGTYTVTVTTHQDSGAEYSDSINVTILPG